VAGAIERFALLPCHLPHICVTFDLVLNTGNAAAAYHVPTSLPGLPQVLPWRLGC
jgi:hypothetical protein